MNYPVYERLGAKVLTKAYAATMVMPTERAVYPQFEMHVTAVDHPAGQVARVTFTSEHFGGFTLNGPDEYFGLLIPQPGKTLSLPTHERLNVRAAINKMPADERPELRWYSVRAFRPELSEIDVDIVLHGDDGPGSAWASQAAVGQTVGFRTGTGAYRAPEPGQHQLLVADESALPAIAAIADHLRAAGADTSTIHAYVEIPDEAHATPYDAPFEVTTLVRGGDKPGSKILEVISEATLPSLDYAWVCGESTIATGVRRNLVKDRGTSRKSVMFSGYWKLGSARG